MHSTVACEVVGVDIGLPNLGVRGVLLARLILDSYSYSCSWLIRGMLITNYTNTSIALPRAPPPGYAVL